MSAQPRTDIVTGASQAMLSWSRTSATFSPVKPVVPGSIRQNDHIAAEAGRLLEDIRRAMDCDLDIASTAAGRLAALLANTSWRDSRPAPMRGGLAPWQKRKVQGYIEERLDARVLVEDLAQLVSLSASYFCRAFKTTFGETPRAYITKARIQRARTLMLDTSDSLSDIALACGLVDQAHLCRRFRQAMGTSPGAWRRSHRLSTARAWPRPGGAISGVAQ
jgi:AraC family transcriptional regulator